MYRLQASDGLLGFLKVTFDCCYWLSNPMKIKYLAAFVASAVLSVSAASLSTTFAPAQASPCAAVEDPCAANPCAAVEDPCAANPCAAADVVTTLEPPHSDVYVETSSEIAIRGADPVAYFTEGEAVSGSSEYEYKWDGATWRFSSKANMEAFTDDPEAFAPQYGGYCAKALSEGNLASIDPRAWKIVSGKLYLNYSKEVQDQWLEDISGNVEKADEFWPGVLATNPLYENQVSWKQ
jgi:YHS domain-containing protein